MKVRESGMPDGRLWESYFDAEFILTQLGVTPDVSDVVEFGCGYGTFTIPAARRVNGTVHTFDVDDSMIAIAKARAEEAGTTNIHFVKRDFIAQGTGLPDGSMDYAMVFNILHHDDPVAMLREAYRNLGAGGRLGVIHWNYDPDTPRGPPMDIRPRPEHCRRWVEEAGFSELGDTVELPPHHYGFVARRPAATV